MSIYYIGLGSNLGDRKAQLSNAISHLGASSKILAVSPVYQSRPMYFLEQDLFLNQVVKIESALEPLALLKFLKELEIKLGRVATFQNGPRSIDLDILFSPVYTAESDLLTLPHPRIAERAFVLLPLNDIAPDEIIQNLGSVMKLCKNLAPSDIEQLERYEEI